MLRLLRPTFDKGKERETVMSTVNEMHPEPGPGRRRKKRRRRSQEERAATLLDSGDELTEEPTDEEDEGEEEQEQEPVSEPQLELELEEALRVDEALSVRLAAELGDEVTDGTPVVESPSSKQPLASKLLPWEQELLVALEVIDTYGELTVAEFGQFGEFETPHAKSLLDRYVAQELVARGWRQGAGRYTLTDPGRGRLAELHRAS